MPFIEENELAALYKEVDKERQTAIFFKIFIKRIKNH